MAIVYLLYYAMYGLTKDQTTIDQYNRKGMLNLFLVWRWLGVVERNAKSPISASNFILLYPI